MTLPMKIPIERLRVCIGPPPSNFKTPPYSLYLMTDLSAIKCKISTQISNQVSDFLVRGRRNHLHMMRVKGRENAVKSQASSRARGEFSRDQGCKIQVLHARYHNGLLVV
jgi:hypothetical protein